MEAGLNNRTMSSATVRGPYPSVNTIFDPPYFSLDTTFKYSNVYGYLVTSKLQFVNKI